jgi:hypothetical protein
VCGCSAVEALSGDGRVRVVTCVLRDGVETRVPIDRLVVGDAFVVRPGEKVATDGEAEGCGEGGSGVAGAVTIVFAFGAQGESIQALVGPHGFDAVPAAGEHFVDVGLVADVEDELIGGGVKNPVKGDAQFHDAQIRAQVTAGPREGVN